MISVVSIANEDRAQDNAKPDKKKRFVIRFARKSRMKEVKGRLPAKN
jgi:hypothetical protein